MSNKHEQKIDKIYTKGMTEIEEYVNQIFEESIKPWLQKYHLNFVAGMGAYYICATSKTPAWFVRKYKDRYSYNPSNRLDHDLIDRRIYNILESSHDATNGFPIGSWMPDFKSE